MSLHESPSDVASMRILMTTTRLQQPRPVTLPLQTSSGGYAMLALDQRESLRAMFGRSSHGTWVEDESLRTFKRTAVDILSPFASAALLDRQFGLDSGRPSSLAPGCGLIVACDVLHQHTGAPISSITFDEEVTLEFLEECGADAIKLLVLWNSAEGRGERSDLVGRALELAAKAGVASLVEGIVRPPTGRDWHSPDERHEAILECASELAAHRPDIYKAEVPGYRPGDVSKVRAQSVLMSQAVGGQWVVLSNGVVAEDFPDAVAESLQGGADGFLAGRAIWADTVIEPDVAIALVDRSIPRLERLRSLVDGSRP